MLLFHEGSDELSYYLLPSIAQLAIPFLIQTSKIRYVDAS